MGIFVIPLPIVIRLSAKVYKVSSGSNLCKIDDVLLKNNNNEARVCNGTFSATRQTAVPLSLLYKILFINRNYAFVFDNIPRHHCLQKTRSRRVLQPTASYRRLPRTVSFSCKLEQWMDGYLSPQYVVV